MNFNKTTSYSFAILNHMAENEGKVYSATLLHKELDIPHQYLRNLLTKLAGAGFISGTRGREGGFILARRKEDIFLADIVEAIEGLDMFATCIMGFHKCPFDEKCAMHDTWMGIRSDIIKVLKETSLATFMTK